MKNVTMILRILAVALLTVAALAQNSGTLSSGTGTITFNGTTIGTGLSSAPPPSNEPVHNYQGEYILITRAWEDSSGWCWMSATAQWSGGTTGGGCGTVQWKYELHPYASLVDAEIALTKECTSWGGSRYPCIYPANGKSSGLDNWSAEFVGIFKLERVLGSDDVKFADGDTVKSHVVEEKEHWFQWTINGDRTD
jgi:hypothetical protein